MIAEDDRGFLLGDGFFDTLRVEGGRALLLGRHLRRLSVSLSQFGMEACWDEVEEAVRQAVKRASGQTGSLRTTVSRGSGPRGLRPPAEAQPLILTRFAAGGIRPRDAAVAELSPYRRSASAPSSRHKTLSYIDNVLALSAAPGAADVVVLNTDDRAASTAMANLFALKDGVWRTPPLTEGCLPGIVREVLLAAGLAEEGLITLEDLRRCPLLRSNSLVGVQPLTLRGGAPSDHGAARRLTLALEEAESAER